MRGFGEQIKYAKPAVPRIYLRVTSANRPGPQLIHSYNNMELLLQTAEDIIVPSIVCLFLRNFNGLH
jgi:hypothetical protein